MHGTRSGRSGEWRADLRVRHPAPGSHLPLTLGIEAGMKGPLRDACFVLAFGALASRRPLVLVLPGAPPSSSNPLSYVRTSHVRTYARTHVPRPHVPRTHVRNPLDRLRFPLYPMFDLCVSGDRFLVNAPGERRSAFGVALPAYATLPTPNAPRSTGPLSTVHCLLSTVHSPLEGQQGGFP